MQSKKSNKTRHKQYYNQNRKTRKVWKGGEDSAKYVKTTIYRAPLDIYRKKRDAVKNLTRNPRPKFITKIEIYDKFSSDPAKFNQNRYIKWLDKQKLKMNENIMRVDNVLARLLLDESADAEKLLPVRKQVDIIQLH